MLGQMGRISRAVQRVRGAAGSYDVIEGLAQLVNGGELNASTLAGFTHTL